MAIPADSSQNIFDWEQVRPRRSVTRVAFSREHTAHRAQVLVLVHLLAYLTDALGDIFWSLVREQADLYQHGR